MTTGDSSGAIEFLDARPTIEVADLTIALRFWNEVAGLATETAMGDPPFFAIVGGGEVKIGITVAAAPAIPVGAACYMTLNGLDDFVERATAAGLVFDPPESHPWGLRDVVVGCPGGGPLIAFGEPT